MKNIKALVKVEARPAVLVSLYFLVVNIGFLLLAYISFNERFKSYLQDGIKYLSLDINGEIFLNFLIPLSVFEILGLILLVYFQFQNDKSIEIGRFIKSLPYTDIQRCLTKMIAGILSYTIPFLIIVIGFILLREHAVSKFKEIYNILPYEEVFIIINRLQNLVNLLVLNYMVYTCLYLFIFMLQYIINNNIGSLVIGILSLLAPGFITVSVAYIDVYEKLIEYLTYIGDKTFLPLYTLISTGNQLSFDMKDQRNSIYINYHYIEEVGFKILITIIISLICLIIIYNVGKRTRIENIDMLIPHSVVRIIFIGGVILCSMFLMADICTLLWGELIGEGTIAAVCIAAIIGAGIGLAAARKIAYIGVARRK